jgi:ABC-type glycerol-3-phosphate transport system substrate-binding protein
MAVGGNYVYRVNIVYTGIDLIEIRDIDTQNSTYLMDFYLWFRYRPNPTDPTFKPDDYIFTNSQDNPTPVLVSDVQPSADNPNGVAYITYRITGTFKNDFDFRAYPFDYQDLIVRFRNQNADTTTIQYVVDRIGMRATRPGEFKTHLEDNHAFRSLYGWRVTDALGSQGSFATTSTMGNPQRFEQQGATRFSLFDVTVVVRRIAIEYLIKSLLPLLLTLILAYISFYLPLGHSERFGVGSTALLTTAFFHLNLATTLPQIGYTVLMEFFFYVSYILSVLIIILETTSIRLEKLGEDEKIDEKKTSYQRTREKLNLVGRVVYPIILAGAFIIGQLIFNGTIVWPPVDKATLRTPVSDIVDLAAPATPETATATQAQTTQGPVTLKLATWRPEDAQEFAIILEEFHQFALQKYNRDIRVEYAPINSTNYDAILDIQLQRKTGPDLFYVRPFTVDTAIASYLLRLEDEQLVKKLEDTYSVEKRDPWQSMWGTYYAVPFVGVVQGVYYNRTIFHKLDLTVPTTWEEFLSVAETLKTAGYIPVANGLNNSEDSEMFMSIATNYIGGSAGRAKYENGSLCFNNSQVVEAFQVMENLLPYLPEGAANLGSKASKQLFRNQRAAMLFGGSWDVKELENEKFDWSVFPVPAPKGRETFVIFQPDIGIGVNADTPYRDEALVFINWLMDKASAPAVAANLPGFYPLGNVESGVSSNTHDVEFLRLASGYSTDVRWIFTGISDYYPRASDIVRQALYEMASKKITGGVVAANRLQNGLAEWYAPAQTCK